MMLSDYKKHFLKGAMLELAVKHVKHYLTDILYDFYKIDELDKEDAIPDVCYFIVRDCGTDFGEISDPNIGFRKENADSSAIWYKIDMKKYIEELPDPMNYSDCYTVSSDCYFITKQCEEVF